MRFFGGRREAGWWVAFGVFMIVWGVYARQQSLRSRNWPTVTGTVVKWLADGRRESSRPSIRYRYQVGGQTYTGELISYDKLWSDEDRMNAYPPGAQVEVHYDPADPAQAVLEPGPGPGAGVKLLVGIVGFAIGLWQNREG